MTPDVEEHNGLVFAHVLDGRGGGRRIDWPEIETWTPDAGVLWLHLNRKNPHSVSWLRDHAGIDPIACDALLAEETRPRSVTLGEGMLLILRGVNLHPDADPEDMISVRLWVDAHRVISLRQYRVMAVRDVREDIEAGRGPADAGELIVRLADRLLERMGPVLEALDERIDDIEEQLVEAPTGEMRYRLGGLRRRAILLRRYLAPQRDALSRLQFEAVAWLGERPRGRLREIGDRLLRYVEDLDAARERAAVVHEEIVARLSEQMNRTMYLLSLVACIFLPLGLVTGLLGINVSGIPGSHYRWAFAIVCGLLVGLAGVQVWLFRRLRLM